MADGPLAGFRILDLTQVVSGPFCAMLLGDLGADVIKVEPPGGNSTRRIGPFYEDKEDIERSLFFWQYNRGKRSIVLDLNAEKDRARFLKLRDGRGVGSRHEFRPHLRSSRRAHTGGLEQVL